MNTQRLLQILLALALVAAPLQAATFVVTNANDSGAGSLRDAINQANGNAQADTINFDPAFFNVARTITLTSGEIQIGSDGANPGRLVVINGPGASLLTISGNNASRIFLLGPDFNASVTMNGMTLRDGNGVGFADPNGGAIFAQVAANLTLNAMVLRNNVITAVARGGAMFMNGVGHTVINDSLITENSAYGEGGFYIDNIQENRFTMRNTTVSNNRATSADVGGFSLVRGTNLIENCRVTGNVATRSFGGIVVFQAVRLDVSDTLISENDGMQDNGGGLSTDGSAIVNLRRLNVSNNHGAGIVIRNPSGVVTIMDSTISNNVLRDYLGFSGEAGGGISTSGESDAPIRIINTTISGNSAPDAGGGIYNFTRGLELINSTVVNNSVTNAGVGKGGGGIFDGELQRSGGNSFGFRFKIQNSIIAGNSAARGPDLYSGFDSAGSNIIGNTADTNSSTAATGDQFNVNPQVGPLADNGGSTFTHALLAGSPAINAGNNALAVDATGAALTSDQRAGAYQRIVNGTVDIGAFEVQPPPNTQPGNNVTQTSSSSDASVTFPAITRAGLTRFEPITATSAGTAPQGYNLRNDRPAFNITTTAEFTGPLLVSITVPAAVTEAEFQRLRILHSENGVLVDRTVRAPETPAPNFATRTISARVTSLSPFVLATAPGQLQNISTRLRVQTGDNVLIGGFIITGTVSKQVILRAIGPSLSSSGVTGALADPIMELRRSDGSLVASNNNWRETQQTEIIATTVPPTNDLESAIVATLIPGNYTAIVRGVNNGTGIGLVEVFDLETNTVSKLANISTRGFVQSGDDVMIGGFIVGPAVSSASKVIVRAIGPSLTSQGVNGALGDTTLELRDASGTLVAQNDDWRSSQEAEIIASTVPPTSDLESALVGDLPAGNYTAIVRGKANATGVALVEVYTLQ